MTNHPSTDGLPFDPGQRKESADRLILSYRNEQGNSAVYRGYRRIGNQIIENDQEWMFNYRTQQWEQVHDFTHRYDLKDDRTTLDGDGSNWGGDGRNWKSWFKERHAERLEIRYQHDQIESITNQHNHKQRSLT